VTEIRRTLLFPGDLFATVLHGQHFLNTRRLKPFVLSVLILMGASGCAERRPVVDREPPGAAPGASLPETTGPENPRPEKPTKATPGHRSAGSGPVSPSRERSRNPSSGIHSAGYVEEGQASWYGVPFHGRRTANGEIYDMNQLTAAHRTLPFDTILRVTNLMNGLWADVRITDRGPFVENRIIDLSRAAAGAIDMVRAGVEPVRLQVISGGNPTAGTFTVQVGAFHDRARAERLRERLRFNYSPVLIEKNSTPVGTFYRVHVGKISGQDAAYQFGEKLRRTEKDVVPFVVRVDENIAEERIDER
jgi:rare lipoprotein A